MSTITASLSRLVLASAGIAALAPAALRAQQLDLPRVSPKASVTQRVGTTDITITYSRPGVKGRVIWGGLVPYGEVWRTGANEATTIAFSDPVSVDGHPLAAGTYALFTIPAKDEWTVIFNRNATQFGAFQYKESEDALRITVKARPAEYREWMTFAFPAVTPSSVEVALEWERLVVPFTVTVDVPAKILPLARKAVAEAKPDDWQTPNRAASFCLDYNVDPDEAAAWLEKSIAIKPTMSNLAGKARLLAARGDRAGAIALAKHAIEVGRAANPKAETGPIEKLIADWEKK